MPAASPAPASPQTLPRSSPPLMLMTKHEAPSLYDFLYNLNYALVWDEHFPLSLEGEEKSLI